MSPVNYQYYAEPLEPAENYGDTLNQVEDALQTSTKLTQSLNSMIPEQYHIGKVSSPPSYLPAIDQVY